MNMLDVVALATIGVGLVLTYLSVSVLFTMALIGAGSDSRMGRWYEKERGVLGEALVHPALTALTTSGAFVIAWTGRVAGIPGIPR